MVKTYHITTAAQFRVMQAMSKDMPPIQLTIHNTTKIMRAGEQEGETNSSAFTKLIVHSNPNQVLFELHRRIDGRRGKAIGIVLAAATYKYNVLSRTPTEFEFNDEFPNIEECSWRSISIWLKKVNRPEDLHKDILDVTLDFDFQNF